MSESVVGMRRSRPAVRVLAAFVCLLMICTCGCGKKQKAPPATKPAPPAPVAKATAPAKLVLERRFVDLGRMEPGSEKDVSVGLRNEGGQRLVIKRVETGCKCVVASLDRQTIESGEAATLSLKVRTLKHKGPYDAHIAVSSNAPGGAELLSLRFEVPRALAAEPEQICFGVVRPGQQLSRKLNVIANRDVASKVLYAIADDESLVGRLVQLEVSRFAPAELDVAMTAPAKPGTYRYSLNIATALKDAPAIRVPVLVSVSSAATVQPDVVDFGRIARGSEATGREIRVTLRAGTRVESVTAKPAVVEVTPLGTSSDNPSLTMLRPKAIIPFGPAEGEVAIRLAGAETCVLTVPFSAYVTDGTDSEQ